METKKLNLDDQLQKLMKTNRNSIEVLNRASHNVNNDPMSVLFGHLKEQRESFEATLEALIEDRGGEVHKESDTKGLAHKIWTDVRSILIYRNEYDMLDEVRKAETAANENFTELLALHELPEKFKASFERQSNIVKEDLKKMEEMQKEYSEKLGISYKL